jgi:NADH:ubiquinone oxidoreductase subunit E
MRHIEVCVGSSCYLKGAYTVLDTFVALVREHRLGDDVCITGAFCKDRCQHGVAVSVDDALYSVADADAARQLFADCILAPREPQP